MFPYSFPPPQGIPETWPCICGCHEREMNKPIRIKNRYMCQACLDATANDYGALIESVSP